MKHCQANFFLHAFTALGLLIKLTRLSPAPWLRTSSLAGEGWTALAKGGWSWGRVDGAGEGIDETKEGWTGLVRDGRSQGRDGQSWGRD